MSVRHSSKKIPNSGARSNRCLSVKAGPITCWKGRTGWVKTAERTPIAYIQHGHDNVAWTNPAFRTILLNAIKWAASKEAKDWAHAKSQGDIRLKLCNRSLAVAARIR